ncbi:MAG: AAA family ATPase [Chitinophagaceae bacterium]|nr:AAA family ATPase [Chitinophagaceae bacterium]
MPRNIANDDDEDFGFGAPPIGDAIEPPKPIFASPFIWRNEADIPPRQWLYGRHLLRKFVSVDVAAGGVGKSSVKIGEALAMASNQPIYGKEISEGPLRVWLYNLEDPHEETERRIHATAKRFEISPEDIGDRLFVDSGRDQALVLAQETEFGTRIIRPVADSLVAEILRRHIDVLVIDPFVSSHAVSENDNPAIDMVTKEWGRISDVCNCSINLVHHVRKGNGVETNTDSSRGAKALTDGARSVIVYNRMSEEEAQNANIPPEERAFYFRIANDKSNLAPPEKADWFRMNNVDLANGDKVGVACPWQWPDLFAGISLNKTKEVQKRVSEGQWRLDPRSENWVGNTISTVLDINPDDDGGKKRLSKIIKQWVATDVLRVVEIEDNQRRPRKFVEVGKWITE